MTVRAPVDEVVDVLVIGAGAAGLSCALGADELRVLVVAGERPGAGGATPLAQGGVAAAIGADDDAALHAEDTLAAGAGLSDQAAAIALAGSGRAVVERLLHWGVAFDRRGDGGLDLGLEAAHRRHRIVHARDETGAAIAAALAAAVERADHVEVRAPAHVEALATSAGEIVGALVRDEEQGARVVGARAVVLCTGGAGALFDVTTNPPSARGEGLTLAAEAGADLADLEFMQFHPTALDVQASSRPLLSEAIRGAGGVLVDDEGRPVMTGLHPLGDLAPRDVVARALFRRGQEGQRTYLDVRKIVESGRAAHFPTMLLACERAALDPRRDLLPVTPAAHYHMGGVVTDLFGRTTVPGLWACGEVACTGVHGANRLASNSLLEAVAFADRVALDVRSSSRRAPPPVVELPRRACVYAAEPGEGAETERLLREVMWRDVGVERDGAGLARAVRLLDDAASSSRLEPRTRAAALAAWSIAAAALLRTESRGAHFRRDYPEPRAAVAKRQRFTLGALRASTREQLAAPASGLR